RLISWEKVEFSYSLKDRDILVKGEPILIIETEALDILKGERTALNFLSRLSGIATLTKKYVDLTHPFKVKILDTRKTTPNLRLLEKYAVKIGGGFNHRFALDDGILIKDNHIKACGGVKEAVARVRRNLSPFKKIEVETARLSQVEAALAAKADIIMLDNMSMEEIKEYYRLPPHLNPLPHGEREGRGEKLNSYAIKLIKENNGTAIILMLVVVSVLFIFTSFLVRKVIINTTMVEKSGQEQESYAIAKQGILYALDKLNTWPGTAPDYDSTEWLNDENWEEEDWNSY
ncbi:unnamed protein product, partial [marine sediment metagenome]